MNRQRKTGIGQVVWLAASAAVLSCCSQQALGQFHGVRIGKSCEGTKCVGQTLDCIIEVGHDDDFNDTLRIVEAFDIVDPKAPGGGTRVPAAGHLPIIDVAGNTSCEIGGTLPCDVCPANGTGCGAMVPDPELPGVVTFRQNTYVVPGECSVAGTACSAETDCPAGEDCVPAVPNPVSDRATVVINDQCDGPGTTGCSMGDNTIQFTASSTLLTCEDDNECTVDVCMDSTCSFPPVTDGTICTDDGFTCTVDECIDGECVHTPDDGPCDDGNECTNDFCDPAHPDADPTTGCVNENVPNDTVCTDDGFSCTDDVCIDGVCTSIPVDSRCGAGNECANEICDPTDPDADPVTGCVIDPLPFSTVCTTCPGGDTDCNDCHCDGAGACVDLPVDPGTLCATCPGGDTDCNNCACDGAGVCANDPEPESTTCASCPDGVTECNDCHCDGAGVCANLPEPDTTACTSCPGGLAECNDCFCDGSGTCADTPDPAGTACANCPGGDTDCNNCECDGAGVCADDPELQSTPCDGCPTGDTECNNCHCDGTGTCADDPEPAVTTCTTCPGGDTDCNNCLCDGAGACADDPEPPSTFCDTCPGGDTVCNDCICDGTGVCANDPEVPGTPCDDDCPGGDTDCNNCICDGDGVCEDDPEPPGTVCVGDAFTCTADECVDGECTTTPVDANCDDGFTCTENICDPSHPQADSVTGCVDIPDHSACDDDNVCTEDLCDPLAVGADPTTGCVNLPEEESTPCEADDDRCTVDHCDGNGACVLLREIQCDPICEQCNPATGICDPAAPLPVECIPCEAECEPIVKAKFDIWNENERSFSGTERCIESWDQTLLSRYTDGRPGNNFLRNIMQTDRGKARIDGLASSVCDSPGGNESISAPLLGLAIRELVFSGGRDYAASELVGQGYETGAVAYDVGGAPPPQSATQARTSLTELLTDDSAGSMEPVNRQGVSPDAVAGSGTQPGPVRPRGGASQKGSLLVYPKIEIKWDNLGNVIQDTVIELSNDYPAPVVVQAYLVHGELCTWVDNSFELTPNQPVYWSALTGEPAGFSPFTVLGEGCPDDDLNNPGGRRLRGYLVLWAVHPQDNVEIRWNHLAGAATVVNYQETSAWEYSPWAFQAVHGEAEHGDRLAEPFGLLLLDGLEYEFAPDKLLMDFFASGSTLMLEGGMIGIDTDLTLWAAFKDLRQDPGQVLPDSE